MSKSSVTRLALVIAALAALLAALPAFAQPLRTASPDLTVRVPVLAHISEAGDSVLVYRPESEWGATPETPTAYRAVAVTFVAGSGAAVGGGMGAVGSGLALLLASGWRGCDDAACDTRSLAIVLGAGAVGSVLGTGYAINEVAREVPIGPAILPDPGIRTEDVRPAMLGALIALPVGAAAGWALERAIVRGGTRDSAPGAYVAIPILQGVGASVAVNLSR